MWSKKYCDSNQNIVLKDVIGNFLEYIQFHKIPANVLMREIHPLGIVPYSIIMNALAYQVSITIPHHYSLACYEKHHSGLFGSNDHIIDACNTDVFSDYRCFLVVKGFCKYSRYVIVE